MTDKRIRFDKFEFPMISGLEYLKDEEKPATDYLFVNEPSGDFSMYFEDGFPIFTVPESTERPYCLFEITRPGRKIKFFCPERHKNLDTAVWYFYMELTDEQGIAHGLPGQIRVGFDRPCLRTMKEKPKFIEVLEGIELIKPPTTNYA